jgi:hypothetical protein
MSTFQDLDDLWEQYSNLPPSESSETTSAALPLVFFERSYLCRNTDGAPFFLLRLDEPTPKSAFKLKHVTFEFNRQFEIISPGLKTEALYISISCSRDVPELHRFFVQSIAAILRASAAETSIELSDRLRDLFSASTIASYESGRGLWGELLFIRYSDHPELSVRAWHRSPNALYDFEFEDYSVEVKTTGGNSRSHIFSVAQLRHAKPDDQLVSIMLRSGDMGITVKTLIDEILKILDPRTSGIFLEKLLPVLGSQRLNLDDESFVVKTTLDSSRIFPLVELKCPTTDVLGLGNITRLDVTLDLSDETGIPLAS